ncbi:MAG TPA: C25 family cysteine peptidase [bacterium]
MSRFFMLCLCIWIAFASLTAFASEAPVVPLGTLDVEHSEANLTVSRTSPELTAISLSSPVVITQDQIVDYQSYKVFGIRGELSTTVEGSPTLPQVTRFYRIANTGGADVVITNSDYDVMDNISSFPVQPEEPGFGTVVRDEAVYSKDGWYPANVVEMSDPMIMRDFRIVRVTLYPVQVNPVTHQARIYRNLSVNVVANNHPGLNELVNPHRPSGAWASRYRALIANLDESALDDATTTPGSYLIIASTNATVAPFVDSLALWKTRKGYKVVVDARAAWTSSAMITQIRSDYQNWDPPLEYVALMGDPSAAFGVPTDGSNYDHSFGLGNTGDDIEDIGVGRLSGNTGLQMTIINAKIMAYERDPYMADTTWYHKAFLYAGVGNSCAGNYILMNWGQQQFRETTRVNNATVLTTSGSVDNTTVTTQVNGGVGYFIWRGSWVGQMASGLAASTTPGNRLPVTFTVTCGTGDFGSGTSISEEWLVAGNSATDLRGGVCGIGTATLNTHNPENTCLASGLLYNITDLGVEAIGDALAGAKAQLYYTYGSQADPYGGTLAGNFTRYCNLMGEPSLSMWTDAPKVLAVTHPTSLNVGARSVDVTVRRQGDNAPVQDALVVLWKRGTDSTWVRGTTDLQGHITLPVNVRQTGSMYLTVTKRNHKPYLYTINCAQAAVNPMLCTWTVDDDNTGGTQGNGNHLMNPGETIDLPTYIRNFGSSGTATGVSATLTSDHAGVTVTSATSSYANIAAGDSALGATPFRIHVASDLQNDVQVLLTVTTTSSAGQTVGVIPLTCAAPEAWYQRQHLSTNFDPGTNVNVQVVVKNRGTVAMTGVNAHLVSGSSMVTASDADAYFGDIAAGALDSNTTDVLTLYSNPLTFRGHQAPMTLILTSSNGFVDTTSFVVSVGTATAADPTGPDAYGYFAYDNTDLTYDLHPTYNYVDISSTGTNLNIADPGDKTTPTPVYSAVVHLPFSFKFYGRVYDSLTVCSNGWCAFGDQSWYDGFRNYAIPAMQAPDAMIGPYWDDLRTSNSGEGVWVRNDATNHRYIVQWKAGVGANYSTPLDFEVILYDTTYAPTATGDGKILVQYNQVTMNVANQYNDEAPGCTIGIQKPGNTQGLQYAYENVYSSGGATVQNGRAILFTTEGLGAAPAALTLLSPEANTVWYQNTSNTVSWYGGNHTDHVRIELSRSGNSGPWETVTASTPNNGVFAFTPSGPVSSNCFAKISSVETPTDTDLSDGAFIIASLRLTSPNGGEVWAVDSAATITWQGGSPSSTIRVELSRAGVTGPWLLLNAAAPNTGQYTVTVPAGTSANCYVRLTSSGDATDTDVSDNSFTIEQIQSVYFDNFENGAGSWSHNTVAPWRDNWNLSTERAYSGTTSWKCGDTGTGNYLDSCDARLTSPVIANLPQNATLSFMYQIQSEVSGQYPDSAYDGGVLELSDNGGPFNPVTPAAGYTRIFRYMAGLTTPYTGPMPGRFCWAEATANMPWTQVQLDLSGYAGHSIQLRWRFGSDRATGSEGWYVDDVAILAPVVAPPEPLVPINATCYPSGNDIILRWDADGNVAYRIYSSLNASGPYDTLEGSTTATAFTIVNGASAARRFYVVVGWDGQ